MKKKVILFFIGLFTLTVLIGVQIFWRGEGETESMEEYTGQQSQITRAEIARMLSLLNYTREELQALDRVLHYKDTDTSKWYDKFINGYCTLGYTKEDGEKEDKFRPMAYFTYGECADLLDRITNQKGEEDNTQKEEELNLKLKTLLEQLQGRKGNDDSILPSEWMELYQEIWLDKNGEALEASSLYIIESWENTQELDKWQTLTNTGIYYSDGLNFAPYLDSKREIYVKGEDILYIGDIVEEETQISNIWIIEKAEDRLKVFVEGCTKEFLMAGIMNEDVNNQVGDLFIEDGKITKVSIKPDRIKGRVLVTNDNYIEIENYGRKALSEQFCIYRTYGKMSMDKNNSIVVGYENAQFVIVGDEICAAIITEPVVAENIRVLLKTTGFKGYYHDKVEITSNSKFKVSYGDKSKSYKANKSLAITSDSKLFESGRITIESEKENGKIKIKSLGRNGINPSYEGKIEIAKDEEGLLVINELSIENYLYYVVPSEMPTSYGIEALKVQSVCARSYAYKQLLANSLRKYGAHVDDSSSYQVYNNIPTNKDAIKAVDATCGETLEYEGEMITAYYFSTSSGYTADVKQVWSSSEEIPYLDGKLQLVKKSKKAEKKFNDLSKEKDFKKFITEDDYKTFDTDSAWYRWKVTISKKKLKESIDASLESRCAANPKLIQVLTKDGSYESKSIRTIGKVKSIEITNRQASGIVTELIVKGSKETIKIQSEYNIRLLLAPLSDTIIRQNGSKVESLSMLPSAYLYIEETGEKNSSLQFIGGGYGHGVGMSQNGAKAMTDAGYSYQEVLEHFYAGTKIAKY